MEDSLKKKKLIVKKFFKKLLFHRRNFKELVERVTSSKELEKLSKIAVEAIKGEPEEKKPKSHPEQEKKKEKVEKKYQPPTVGYSVEKDGYYLSPVTIIIPFAPKMKKEKVSRLLKKTLGYYLLPEEEEEKEKMKINEIYPLYPPNPKRGEEIFAWAHIHWDPTNHELVYEVIEPPLTFQEKMLLKEIEKKLEELLDVLLIPKDETSYKEYLKNKIREILDLYGWEIPEEVLKKLEYYVIRDFLGYGPIDPLMHDPNIEDISCDGVGIPVFVVHRNPKYGQMRTNIVFRTKDELDAFVMKLAQRAGKSISVAKPLLDATLPDGSRLQATLGSDIARRGSNFTIRKFTREPLTPIHLIEYGTANALVMAYFWLSVEHGANILIAGATATGKTTFLNAISLFIRPEMKIVSIEDTAELQLPHENWVPQVARSTFGAGSYGAVELFDLLKAALRQRPDYVIVGEVRGKEASVMFQGMATGHPALATIHADSLQKIVDRLITPPINLSPALLENLDIVVFLKKLKLRGLYVRRVSEVLEIEAVDVRNLEVKSRKVFKWIPEKDIIVPNEKSLVLERIAKIRGKTYEEIYRELERRALLLEWMRWKGIKHYAQFTLWINAYYANPKRIMEMVINDVKAGRFVPETVEAGGNS